MYKRVSRLIICVIGIVCCASGMIYAAETESAYKDSEVSSYIIMADSEREAEQICKDIHAELISYQYGMATINLSNELSTNDSKRSNEVKIYPNYQYSIDYAPQGLENNQQWHISELGVENAWKYSTGKNVKVAVIDSGIDQGNDAINKNIVGAVTVIPSEAYGSNGFFKLYEGPNDNLGHGTSVSGIIGANTDDRSIMGIAPECSIYSIKALEKSGNTATGYTDWIAAAVLHAVENDVDIINMSIGGSTQSDEVLKAALDVARKKGCIIVCAAGNYKKLGVQDRVDYPARYESTLAVSAGKQTDEGIVFDGSYSKYGEDVDFLAPGTKILCNDLNNGKSEKSGTSFACPMVSGTIALLKSVAKDKTEDEIIEALRLTAIDKGEIGKDRYYGYGIIDPEQAVKKISGRSEEETEPHSSEETSEEESVTEKSSAEESSAVESSVEPHSSEESSEEGSLAEESSVEKPSEEASSTEASAIEASSREETASKQLSSETGETKAPTDHTSSGEENKSTSEEIRYDIQNNQTGNTEEELPDTEEAVVAESLFCMSEEDSEKEVLEDQRRNTKEIAQEEHSENDICEEYPEEDMVVYRSDTDSETEDEISAAEQENIGTNGDSFGKNRKYNKDTNNRLKILLLAVIITLILYFFKKGRKDGKSNKKTKE